MARLAALAVWVGTFGAVALALGELDDLTQARPAEPTRLVWVDAPDWLTPHWETVLAEVEAGVQLYDDTLIRDPRVCPYVYERVEESPWIEQVHRVSKHADGTVRVAAAFRKPFALVERPGYAYLVDEAGIRLPREMGLSAQARRDWLVIRGAEAPRPELGRRWPGEDLQAGLKLARFLYSASPPFRPEIVAIDVAHVDNLGGRLRLITRNPASYIIWGLPPGEEYGVEAPAEKKLRALASLFAEYGSLSEGGPIDMRADGWIWRGKQ